MILIMWAVIGIAVLAAVLLIYLEHEWGFALGGLTAAVLIVCYFAAGLMKRSGLIALMPQGSTSHFDIMAVMAGALLVPILIVAIYVARRRRAKRR